MKTVTCCFHCFIRLTAMANLLNAQLSQFKTPESYLGEFSSQYIRLYIPKWVLNGPNPASFIVYKCKYDYIVSLLT